MSEESAGRIHSGRSAGAWGAKHRYAVVDPAASRPKNTSGGRIYSGRSAGVWGAKHRYAVVDPAAPQLIDGAGDGVRTRDTELGKLVLYQLSYARSEKRSKTILGRAPSQRQQRRGHAPGSREWAYLGIRTVSIT